jgi:hypothetical protein
MVDSGFETLFPTAQTFEQSETGVNSNSPLNRTMFAGVYDAEYALRMSIDPNMLAVGFYNVASGDNSGDFIAAGTNHAPDAEQVGDGGATTPNGTYVAGSVTPLDTTKLNFNYFMQVPGLAMGVANQAINNSTTWWPTTVSNSPTVAYITSSTSATSQMPAIYAQAYYGTNSKRYLVVTNKSGSSISTTVDLNGTALTGTFFGSWVSSTSAADQNTTFNPTAILVNSSSSLTNPVEIPPYCVMRIEY